MYFWHIQSLKEDLASSNVSEPEPLYYMLWWGGAYTVSSAIPLYEFNFWDYVDSATIIITFLFGTLYEHLCNGSTTGDQFLLRYIAVSWVLTIRFLVLVIVPTLAALLFAEHVVLDGIPEATTPIESTWLAVILVSFYVRLGHHLSYIAHASEEGPR